jgi:hypothetical protein
VLRIRRDWQMPSTRKLMNLAGMTALLPLAERFGTDRAAPPFRIPIPGVRIAWATPNSGSTHDAA